MKRFILFLISSCAIVYSYAQEEIRFDSIPKNKISLEPEMVSPVKPLIFEGTFPMDSFNLTDETMVNQPLLPDFNKNLDLKKYPGTSLNLNISGNSWGSYFNPYLSSFQIFNRGSFRLNERFSVGGNSFGARTIFDAPVMNPGIQNMNVRGASMFMQYKISDKFKVETRFSISNHKSPFEP
jgi:hypothetical protein